MNRQTNDSFLIQCKVAYLEGETPTNNLGEMNKKFPELISIAEEYFRNNSYQDFAEFFQEGQYFIDLWTAHLILEYGLPNERLRLMSIGIIEKYSDNSLIPRVAENERKWLQNHILK